MELSIEALLECDPRKKEIPFTRMMEEGGSLRLIRVLEDGIHRTYDIRDVIYWGGVFQVSKGKESMVKYFGEVHTVTVVSTSITTSSPEVPFKSYEVGSYIRVKGLEGVWRILAIYSV